MAGGIPWVEMIGAALSGGALKTGADMIFGRESRHVKALGDTIHALAEQLETADKRQDRFSERLTAAEGKVEACEEKHDECERRVRAVGEELSAARVEIAMMLSGPVPPYRPEDLSRGTKKR